MAILAYHQMLILWFKICLQY